MTKNAIILLMLPLVLTACGPSDFEKQKLAFEEQKYKDGQAAKVEAAQKEEQDKQEQTQHWMSCRLAAQQQYDGDLGIWGEPVSAKPGIRTGPANQLKEMKDRLQRQNEECNRIFPKGISY